MVVVWLQRARRIQRGISDERIHLAGYYRSDGHSIAETAAAFRHKQILGACLYHSVWRVGLDLVDEHQAPRVGETLI